MKITIFQTNQYGEKKKNKRCYPFNYITFHFKSTRKSICILQNIVVWHSVFPLKFYEIKYNTSAYQRRRAFVMIIKEAGRKPVQ